jgi:hypothetical protein
MATSFRRSKPGQIGANFLHAHLHQIHSNFCFWLNLIFLTKTQERDVPTIINIEISDLAKFLRSKTAQGSVLKPQFD